MKQVRTKRSAALKFEVALAAIDSQTTIADLSRQYGVNPCQIHAWRKSLIDGAVAVFTERTMEQITKSDQRLMGLFKQIEDLSAEIDVMRADAKLLLPRPIRLGLIDRKHPNLSITKQCRLLSLNRSTLYYDAYQRGRHADK